MTRVLLAFALVVSLWPAAVIALAAERVLGGGGGEEAATAPERRTSTTAPPARTRERPAPAQASPPASTTTTAATPAGPDLAGLDRLRDETADLVVALNASTAAVAGRPDTALAAQALEVEGEIVAWQEANEGTSTDAEFFAALFADIASAAADFATAPSPEGKARLDEAVERHRRETLQDGH